jgi:hypothetical protein
MGKRNNDMEDFRDKWCIIDGCIIKKCIAQDFFPELLYFELKPEHAHMDSKYCDVPSIAIEASRITLLGDKPGIAILYGMLK